MNWLGLVMWISDCGSIGEEHMDIPGSLLGPASEIDWVSLDSVEASSVLIAARSERSKSNEIYLIYGLSTEPTLCLNSPLIISVFSFLIGLS